MWRGIAFVCLFFFLVERCVWCDSWDSNEEVILVDFFYSSEKHLCEFFVCWMGFCGWCSGVLNLESVWSVLRCLRWSSIRRFVWSDEYGDGFMIYLYIKVLNWKEIKFLDSHVALPSEYLSSFSSSSPPPLEKFTDSNGKWRYILNTKHMVVFKPFFMLIIPMNDFNFFHFLWKFIMKKK